MIRLYLAAAALLAIAVVAFGLWWGGVQNERSRLEADTNKTRIETMKQNKGDRDAAQNLDDDSLIDTLGRWILP